MKILSTILILSKTYDQKIAKIEKAKHFHTVSLLNDLSFGNMLVFF